MLEDQREQAAEHGDRSSETWTMVTDAHNTPTHTHTSTTNATTTTTTIPILP